MLLETILTEIRSAKLYTLIIDEVSAYNEEFMSICARYVEGNGIKEVFLKFSPLERCDAAKQSLQAQNLFFRFFRIKRKKFPAPSKKSPPHVAEIF